jgi:ATP-dependent Clp protease adaptor protein ClpS
MSDVDVKDKIKVRKKKSINSKVPKTYFVILLNDDYTPMEFVIYILKSIFNKTTPDAERIMLNVHKLGEGIAGLYSYQIAEQKAVDTLEEAKKNKYPLLVTLRESE